MPVKLERPEQLSPQDIIDLNKIELEVGQTEKADWQIQLTDALKRGDILINGRFNDRIITRLWLQPSAEQSYKIIGLSVRKVTRGRGVARQLLTLLCRLADQQGWHLEIEASDFSRSGLFLERGFTPPIENTLSRQPQA